MTRLEKYNNILLPVDDIVYAQYRKQDKKTWTGHDYDEESGTFVWIKNGWYFNMVKISKKNVLDDFKKWYDETMTRIGKGEETGTWTWTYTSPENDNTPFDRSPHVTWSTLGTMVQHDGMEHPL